MRFVTVDSKSRLEVLDWGGTGEAVVLLAGLGNTAHVFDEFAPKLTGRFRVIGLTRRGFGASSQPGAGYDISTLTDDVRRVIDSLALDRVNLVGHSIAGEEITLFAGRYPQRILRAVYLDAAYDRVGFAPDVPAPPQATPEDLASPLAVRAYRGRLIALQPEAEIRATVTFRADGRAEKPVTPASVFQAIMKSVTHPVYASVAAPALAIYAVATGPRDLAPTYEQATPENRVRLDRSFERFRTWATDQRRKFKAEVRQGRVVELRGANHYVFVSNEADLLRETLTFLGTRRP